MKYQRGDCGATLMIAMVVLMVGYFSVRGHGGGMHHVAEPERAAMDRLPLCPASACRENRDGRAPLFVVAAQ